MIKELSRKFQADPENYWEHYFSGLLRIRAPFDDFVPVFNYILKGYDMPYNLDNSVITLPLRIGNDRQSISFYYNKERGFLEQKGKNKFEPIDVLKYLKKIINKDLFLEDHDETIEFVRQAIKEIIEEKYDPDEWKIEEDKRLEGKYGASFSGSFNSSRHQLDLNLHQIMNTFRFEILIERYPHRDFITWINVDNLNYGGGWEVQGLRLSGDRYRQVGYGGWDVDEDDYDFDQLEYEDLYTSYKELKNLLEGYFEELENIGILRRY